MKDKIIHTLMVILALMFIYLTWQEIKPHEITGVKVVVPTDQKVYYPGDEVGFKVDQCVTKWEIKKISYQLETDQNQQNFVYKNLGTFETLGYPGCFSLLDTTVSIPQNIFKSGKIKPGRFRIFIWTGSPVSIYQTDWFEIHEL